MDVGRDLSDDINLYVYLSVHLQFSFHHLCVIFSR